MSYLSKLSNDARFSTAKTDAKLRSLTYKCFFISIFILFQNGGKLKVSESKSSILKGIQFCLECYRYYVSAFYRIPLAFKLSIKNERLSNSIPCPQWWRADGIILTYWTAQQDSEQQDGPMSSPRMSRWPEVANGQQHDLSGLLIDPITSLGVDTYSWN